MIQIKNEITKPATSVLMVIMIIVAGVSYVNTPTWIEFNGMLQDIFKYLWSVVVVLSSTFVVVVAKKAGEKWWTEKGEKIYEKIFKIKTNRKNKRR